MFKLKGKDIPIVHRVLEIHTRADGKEHILTKGDNNKVDDRGLYNQGTRACVCRLFTRVCPICRPNVDHVG